MSHLDAPGLPANGAGRRQFMQATAVLGGAALLQSEAQAAGTSLEGYTSAPSVAAGGTLDFFLRDPQAVGAATTVYPVTVTRIGAPDSSVLFTQVAIGNQVVPSDASTNGCRWAASWRLSVPATWPSGLYFAFVGDGANACTVPFVVRAASPTASAKALVQIEVTTAHAYNSYGGKSLYDYNSSGGVRSPRVSLDRPFTESFNSFFDSWAQWLVRWLAKNNIAADFCTDIDVIAMPSILDAYPLFVSCGHDEYWTLGRRQTVDAYVARGGNVAFLGANTAWFQCRVEPGINGQPNRTIVCYKDAAADPSADPATKTTNFVSLVPPNPENRTTGLSYLNGCSWTGSNPRPNTPWLAQREEHWVLAGTGVARNGAFGAGYVGYECDACLFTRGAADGRAVPTATDGTPATLRVLALADGSNWNAISLATGGFGEQSGWAMIAVFSRGNGAGTVFNAGAVDWCYGLIPEINGQAATPISRITRNVFDKLSARWTESADVRQFSRAAGTAISTYYGTEAAAPADSAMALDGLAFRGFTSAVAGSVPVYRYRSTTLSKYGLVWRLSTATSLAPVNGISWVQDGIACHAFAAAGTGTQPVYEHRFSNAAAGEFWSVYSTSATPPSGWTAGPVVFHGAAEGTANATAVQGFTLSAGAASLSAQAGQVASTTVQVVGVNGFARAVSFSASGLPAGVMATFNPSSSSTGTTLTLSSTAATVAGSYTVIVNGSAAAAGGQPAASATLTLTLVITAAPAVGSFTLSPSTSSKTMWLGGVFGDSIDVLVRKANGFNGTVAFSVTGLPSGMGATFSPTSSSTGTRMTLKATSWAGATRGTFTLTVAGTSGALRATTSIRLTVL